MKYVNRKQNQKGIALLEMIIAIGIIGIITAAVVALSGSAFEEQKKKDLIANLSQAVVQVQKSYASSPDYKGISNAILSDTAKKNPFGADFTVQATATSGTSADDAFSIGILGLEPKMCIELIQSIGASFQHAFAGSAPAAINSGSLIGKSAADLKTGCATANITKGLWLSKT